MDMNEINRTFDDTKQAFSKEQANNVISLINIKVDNEMRPIIAEIQDLKESMKKFEERFETKLDKSSRRTETVIIIVVSLFTLLVALIAILK